jgi:hypothetical protein
MIPHFHRTIGTFPARCKIVYSCLRFDRPFPIGQVQPQSVAQHPCVTFWVEPEQNPPPLSDHSRKSTMDPWHGFGVANDPAGRKSNEGTKFSTCLRPMDKSTDAPVPRCRVPMRSKGKQRVGAVAESASRSWRYHMQALRSAPGIGSQLQVRRSSWNHGRVLFFSLT